MDVELGGVSMFIRIGERLLRNAENSGSRLCHFLCLTLIALYLFFVALNLQANWQPANGFELMQLIC